MQMNHLMLVEREWRRQQERLRSAREPCRAPGPSPEPTPPPPSRTLPLIHRPRADPKRPYSRVVRACGLPATEHVRRPTKQRRGDLQEIMREFADGCCHRRCVLDSLSAGQTVFAPERVQRARLPLLAKSEPEALSHIAALLTPLLTSEGSVRYMVGGSVVCRKAFLLYYGLKDRKFNNAVRLARGTCCVALLSLYHFTNRLELY